MKAVRLATGLGIGVVAAAAVAGVVGTALAAPPATTAAMSATAAGLPSHAPNIAYQEWLYPGPSGSATCSAAAEFGDGRVKNGVLKPEYYDINSNGNLVLESASDPGNACNGYSAANVAAVRAHSTQQYVTVSLADLPSEEALTGNATKVKAAVSTLTSFVKSIAFTGVDIDFENYWSWTGNDQANYYGFLSELAASLHASGLKLQVEGPPDTTTGFNYGKVLSSGADQVVMMAYDDEYQSPSGSTCLAISPFAWMKNLISGALAQIPGSERSSFVAGLPAYGYVASSSCQKITGNVAYTRMQSEPGFSSSASVIAARRDRGSGEIRWSQGGVFYDYVDQTALDEKLALARSLGVDNVSVWVLGGSNPWFSSAGSGATELVSQASGRCLDDPGNATANLTLLDVWSCDGQPGQSFHHASNGELQVLGKCVDADGQKTAEGTPVILYSCNGGTNQQWTETSSGQIVGVQSGLCLDVTGGAVNAPNGTPMELWPCTGKSNQSWTED